jgi:hypothetical protein
MTSSLIRAAALAAAMALGSAPLLAGCGTLSGLIHPPSHIEAEKALIDCDTAYVAIASVVAALPADRQAAGRAIQVKAWAALQAARDLYAADHAPDVTALAGLAAQAQALQGAAR